MNGIETERALLRMISMDDLDAFTCICSNPRVMKYIGLTCQPIFREEVQSALASMLAHWDRNGFGRWAVVDKQGDKLIGYAGLRSHEGTPEIVYLLDEPYWNKGIGTEISEAIIKFGFEVTNFSRIIAMTRPENVASIRVMEKIGMTHEKGDVIYGISAVVYAISDKEYRSKLNGSPSLN